MSKWEFTLNEKAIPKARSRHTSFNGISRHYTPATTVKFESMIGKEALKHITVPSAKPVHLGVRFAFAMSKSTPKYYKENYMFLSHTIKPDLDNLLKSVKDGLNGVAWVDDSQVVLIRAVKVFAPEDSITIQIVESSKLPFVKRLKDTFLKLIGKHE